jgi:hypothetical protein
VQLAAQAGTGYPTFSRAENGHPARLRTLRKYAHVLYVPVGALLADAPAPPPPPPPGTPLVLRTRSRVRCPYRAVAIREEQRSDPLYLRQLACFETWLLAQQHRPDHIGAIARAADTDPAFRCLAAEGAPTRRPTAPDLLEAWSAWGRCRRYHLHCNRRQESADAGTGGGRLRGVAGAAGAAGA